MGPTFLSLIDPGIAEKHHRSNILIKSVAACRLRCGKACLTLVFGHFLGVLAAWLSARLNHGTASDSERVGRASRLWCTDPVAIAPGSDIVEVCPRAEDMTALAKATSRAGRRPSF